MKIFAGVALVMALASAAPGTAQDTRTETVHFKAGDTGATLEGRIKGYESVNYMLGAAQGQSMVVILRPDNASAYFNIFAPGTTPGADEALFIGSVSGTEYEGTLPATGDYTIQVYLMRNAARREEVANYTLEIGID